MSIANCKLINLAKVAEPRGNLIFIEGEQHIPFEIKRIYYLYDIPTGALRGGHGHKELQQLMIATSGSFNVQLDDGHAQKTIHLNNPAVGLYISPMVWRELTDFSSGSVCLVLASMHYSEEDYYRDYDDFKKAVV